MDRSEFELELEFLTNRIELKRSFLNFLKNHSTDQNRIEPIEKRLNALEQELAMLRLKKPLG